MPSSTRVRFIGVLRTAGGLLLCAGGLLLLLVPGCGEAGPETPSPPAAARSGEATSAGSVVGAEVAPSRAYAQPRVQDGRVWLRARDEDPRRLLYRLSEAAGFSVEATDLDPLPISVDFEGTELATVVSALARELPFVLDYELDANSGRHVVVSIRVGSTEASIAAPAPGAGVEPAPVRREPARAPRRSPEQERLMRALEIANTDARRELVEELEPVGGQLEALAHVLREDPDPELRSLAAETLATADSYGAVRTLVEALGDEDPEVLLEVIEALEFAGDESIVADLRPLLGHDDRRVRAAAQEAIEFLE